MFDTDVLIAGCGPAGLAAALACRRQGLRVIVIDARRPPLDKPCGEGLMPGALHALNTLGVAVAGKALPFRGVSFVEQGARADGDFPDGWGAGVRRTVLHHMLLCAAVAEGVEIEWNCPATAVSGHQVTAGARRLRARWIVGADGAASRVRAWMNLAPATVRPARFGFRRHFRSRLAMPYMEIHWGRTCQFFLTPVSEDELCVALLTCDSGTRIAQALDEFPLVAGCLAGRRALDEERGFAASALRLPRVTRGNVALIGDASGTLDPITGCGLTLAFQQALTLAQALVEGDLHRYEAAHRRIQVRPRIMERALLMLAGRPRFRKAAIAALRFQPGVFSQLLGLHARSQTGLGAAS